MRTRRHPLYGSWSEMIQRCTNPKNKDWKNYGARGITVCPKWRTFSGFLEDVGEKPQGMTLDRIDNDRGYLPGNWRWASRSVQSSNRRSEFRKRVGTSSRFVGVTWSKAAGKWQASISRDCKTIYLGLFSSQRAARKRVVSARELKA